VICEANLVERKRLASEVKKACEEACSLLNKESLDIEIDSISKSLGKIDITKINLIPRRTWKKPGLQSYN
jgi:hypothetical protein